MAEQKKQSDGYVVGDRVLIKPSKKGQILAIVEGGSGINKHFGPGKWYGIRLTEKKGTCNGQYKSQGPFYFKCPPNFGAFVQQKLIIKKLGNDETFDFLSETSMIEQKKELEDEKYTETKKKIKALKKAFKDLDKDSNLSLEEKEFAPLAINNLGCNDAEAKKLFKEIDVSGNGQISFAEFDGWLNSGAISGIDKLLQYSELKKAFKLSDKDGNMSLDLNEFIKLAKDSMKLESDNAKKLFDKIDVNQNGSVSFAEFEAYVDDLGGIQNFNVYSQIIEEFKKADKDKNGVLDKNEFIKLVKVKLNINKFKAGKMFNSIEKAKEDALALEEFESWVNRIGGVAKIKK